jgi:hypothetical protein
MDGHDDKENRAKDCKDEDEAEAKVVKREGTGFALASIRAIRIQLVPWLSGILNFAIVVVGNVSLWSIVCEDIFASSSNMSTGCS